MQLDKVSHYVICVYESARQGEIRSIKKHGVIVIWDSLHVDLGVICIYNALWSGSTKNRDVSTGPLTRPFAHSLAPLTHLLAPDCLLGSRPPLRSLVRSPRSLRSPPSLWDSDWLDGYLFCVFFLFWPIGTWSLSTWTEQTRALRSSSGPPPDMSTAKPSHPFTWNRFRRCCCCCYFCVIAVVVGGALVIVIPITVVIVVIALVNIVDVVAIVFIALVVIVIAVVDTSVVLDQMLVELM